MTKEKTTYTNEQITAPQIRLIDVEGNQVGIVTAAAALKLAQDAGVDLVEISPNASPPVCRLMDYRKFVFEQRKQKAAANKKTKKVMVKEMTLRPNTAKGDYLIKLEKMKKFLEEGDKVRVSLRFRGREISHQELGFELIDRIKKDLEPFGTIEQFPRLEGRQVAMMIGPKKK